MNHLGMPHFVIVHRRNIKAVGKLMGVMSVVTTELTGPIASAHWAVDMDKNRVVVYMDNEVKRWFMSMAGNQFIVHTGSPPRVGV